ncbi:tRNA pseudouridine(38-40) synthase [Tremella mesenterica]|uniref:tRNA pseudouridine(38-40) synthase n=1 Tax=Tremella mesenterica TaxID=5217 RepID=A0A4Q1BCT2_TREME|nr:tRNA pseudouridine(38-40) synthase [Tremella mesenterica]
MSSYANMSRKDLIARITTLESYLPSASSLIKINPDQSTSSSTTSFPQSAGPSHHSSSLSPPMLDNHIQPDLKDDIKKPKVIKSYDHSSHPTRHIALLFAYNGWPYSGVAYQLPPAQQAKDPLPTVEGELLKALEKTRLVRPNVGLEGCGYGRCGRTDRGVSSAGQVASLWVRSVRKDGVKLGAWKESSNHSFSTLESNLTRLNEETEKVRNVNVSISSMEGEGDVIRETPSGGTEEREESSKRIKSKTTKEEELSYPRLLNSVLPPSIRVLAWAPVEEDFDSRFSCEYRHYKYIFHRKIPGFHSTPNKHPPSSIPPTTISSTLTSSPNDEHCSPKISKTYDTPPSLSPSNNGSVNIDPNDKRYVKTQSRQEGELDIPLMTLAAQSLIGTHDFRNFCKLDGSKQLLSHVRRILQAYFEPSSPDTIVFNLIGTAFLWHQVRHIVAILFLIGSHLESPTLVSNLLDVEKFPARPNYATAHPLPLTLWECKYDPEPDWRYGPYDGPWRGLSREEKEKVREGAEGKRRGLERELESMKQEAETKAWQIGNMQRSLRRVLRDVDDQQDMGTTDSGSRREDMEKEQESRAKGAIQRTTIYPTGAGEVMMHSAGKYKKVEKREMGPTPEEVNRRWLEGRGAAKLSQRQDDE